MTVINMDCVEGMRLFPDAYFDSIVTDPPYELGFMGKAWDATGIANSVEMWREALRVLKPGGHLLAFSGSRTYHRMVCAIEDAGFEIRDQIMWVYGSGFPKSMNVSKAIDGIVTRGRSDSVALREVNETRPGEPTVRPSSTNGHRGIVGSDDAGPSVKRDTPSTEAARQWQGWGTALKPAHEPIVVARKPLIGTVAANVLAHGTGAINVDGCRVNGGARPLIERHEQYRPENFNLPSGSRNVGDTTLGRWPANLIHDGSEEVVAAFPDAKGAQGVVTGKEASTSTRNNLGLYGERATSIPRVESETSAARFFYCAKASKSDRNEGLDAFTPATTSDGRAVAADNAYQRGKTERANTHPTVKPTELMRYLCRLVTPPGGLVLDPFAGSGSTGKAAALEGFAFIGFELSEHYTAIAHARIEEARRVA